MSAGRAARIAPGDRRDVGIATALVARVSGLVAGTTDPNLFLTLGRHRRLFRGWLHFAGGLMPGGRLRRRETEMVILRVAHHRSCSYELDHHRALGAKAGLTRAEIDALTADVPPGGWSERESAILAATDELLVRRDIDDATWHRLAAHLDERELIEVVLLVGQYDMLATAIATLGIEPDRRRRG